MTCREKLKVDNPEWDDFTLGLKIGGCCPGEFGYPENLASCDNCKDCWNQEIPENDIPEEVIDEFNAIGNPNPIPPEDLRKTLENTAATSIKDSGNRREFSSGAVRDMQDGKGRFDLVPLEVMSDMLGTKERDHDPVLLDIATFMYEHDTAWLIAALDNFADQAYGGCLPTMFLEVAKHFEAGAKKYSPGNWKKGIPVDCYIDSAVRHYMKWRRGDNDESHDRAFCWNLMCCIWEVDYGETWRKDRETK